LGDEGEEEGNLELNLRGIDAVEEAIEFGIAEGGFQLGVGGSFFGEEFVGIIAGFLIVLGIVSVKTGSCTREGAREGVGDRAKIGGFEMAVVIIENGTKTGGAVVKLIDVFFGIRFSEVDDEGDDTDYGESDETTKENLGDEAGFRTGGIASDRTRSLGDVVEILKIIHMLIITN